MRLRFFGIALGLLFFVPAVASADAHRWGASGGGGGASGSQMWGVHTTFDYTFYDVRKPDARVKFFNLIYDFSVHSGTHEDADVTIKTGLTGLGVRWARNSESRHVFGVQGMVGGVSSLPDCFAGSLGGLYEYVKHRSNNGMVVAVRGQYDYIGIKGDTRGFHRYSGSLVFRFQTGH
jgi:hypothetical protein